MPNDTEPINASKENTVRSEDRELLRRYVEARDERAFGECVQRHVDLVHSVALRRLNGDAHSAADVTQQVFTALARQAAGLARGVVLPPWLYTTTRHLCANFVRTEQSRRTREREAHTMNELHATTPSAAEWERLRPLLDDVIDELGESDRSAVLLRFFARRPFAEIGASLQVSEDAARMRVDRALEKLRTALTRRGIVSTGAALSALLTHNAVLAAPAGLSALATGAALSSSTAASALTFMALTKLHVALGVAVLGSFFAGVLVTKYSARDVLQPNLRSPGHTDANGAPRSGSPMAPSNLSHGGTGVPRRGDSPTLPPAARGQLQAETAVALQIPSVPEKYFALISILQRLTTDNWQEVLTAFVEERKLTGLAHSEAFELFARRAGEVVGKEAVSLFLGNRNISSANQALMGWASKSPAEALQWLGRAVDPDTRRSVLGGAIRGLALSEPDLAIRTLEGLPANERSRYTGELVTSMLRAVGIDQTQGLVENMITSATQAGTLRAGYLMDVFSDYALLRLRQSAANGTLPDTVHWLDRHVGQPYVDHKIIADVTARLAPQNPQETFRWLEGVNTTLLRAGDGSTAGYRVLLATWANKDGAPVVETWLHSQAAHPHYDHLAYHYAALLAGRDPQKAAHWADSIKNETVRKDALVLIQSKQPKKP